MNMDSGYFSHELERLLGRNLVSVILYGSQAAGDYNEKKSDYNILIILSEMNLDILKRLSPMAMRWTKQGNPSPLLFTKAQLISSADAFPVEFSDIMQCHRLLYGEDLFAELVLEDSHLRLQLERELRGKLILLRERFLLTGAKPKQIIALLDESSSSFFSLFKAVLRLYQREDVPPKKFEAIEQLSRYVPFDLGAIRKIQEHRDGIRAITAKEAENVFSAFMRTIECVINAVDALKFKETSIGVRYE
ncbi:MAG: hypothetical protein EOL87_03005 [Spartobacteria bacterium]|nr:hypothetical protein [Spartobacteria bacterium]